MPNALSLTAIGSSHVQRGVPCQDSSSTLALDPATHLMVVADGAGSAEYSHIGSRRAVELVSAFAVEHWRQATLSPEGLRLFLQGLLSRVAHEFQISVGNDSRMMDGRLSDYSTTLALTVVSWPWIAYGGIGDAFLVGADPDDQLHLLVSPVKEGEFRNETEFLNAGATVNYRIFLDNTLSGLVLSTDGLEKFIEERVVEDPVQGRRPVMWAPSRTFVGLLAAAQQNTPPAEISAALSGDEFQKRKGDDIGVSVVWR